MTAITPQAIARTLVTPGSQELLNALSLIVIFLLILGLTGRELLREFDSTKTDSRVKTIDILAAPLLVTAVGIFIARFLLIVLSLEV
jgi:hypothetical protein